MKKLFTLMTSLAMAVLLSACALSSFGVTNEDNGVHAVAKGGADGASAGKVVVGDGEGLCINHIVNRGSFHVMATDDMGRVVFDEVVTDNVADLVDVQGEFDVEISADKADGTVDVITYDKEAQAQADATLDDAVKSATGKTAEELGLSSKSSDSAAK